jgi:hypothetical protein
VSPERLPDDEMDRLLREALPDDLPSELEDELLLSTRAAWRRTKAPSSRSGWWKLLVERAAWRTVLPQPALVAASVLMLAVGAAMLAAPLPREVGAALEGRRAWTLTARALERAAEMSCTVVVVDAGGHARRHRIVWTRGGGARVHLEEGDGAVERVLRTASSAASVLFPAAPPATGDPELAPVRDVLSPFALAGLLAHEPWIQGEQTAPFRQVSRVGARQGEGSLRVTVDDLTHLPLRVTGRTRDGREMATTCSWP